MHSLVYHNVLKLLVLNVKICIDNKGESNRKLPKMITGKNLWMTQKKLYALI